MTDTSSQLSQTSQTSQSSLKFDVVDFLETSSNPFSYSIFRQPQIGGTGSKHATHHAHPAHHADHAKSGAKSRAKSVKPCLLYTSPSPRD